MHPGSLSVEHGANRKRYVVGGLVTLSIALLASSFALTCNGRKILPLIYKHQRLDPEAYYEGIDIDEVRDGKPLKAIGKVVSRCPDFK